MSNRYPTKVQGIVDMLRQYEWLDITVEVKMDSENSYMAIDSWSISAVDRRDTVYANRFHSHVMVITRNGGKTTQKVGGTSIDSILGGRNKYRTRADRYIGISSYGPAFV